MSEDRGTLSELEAGMAPILGAFRPVLRIEDGSGRLSLAGTAFLVRDANRVFAITAKHVLEGPEHKLLGINENGSVTWPRKYSALAPSANDLPDADVAWAMLERSEDILSAGTAIPFGLAASAIDITPGASYLAVGQPASRARMVNAHQTLASDVMMAFLEPATGETNSIIGVDARVQFAFTYPADSRDRISRGESVPAKANGMSGGAIVVTGRVKRESQPSIMVPLVAGVLTHYYPKYFTFVATKIEHIWATLGYGGQAANPLYSRTTVQAGA